MIKKMPVLGQTLTANAGESAPKIEFPCANYPLKVIGHNTADFKQYVIDVMKRYDDAFDSKKVTCQDSKNGKFRSVRMFMTAQSEAQLVELNAEFKSSGKVVTVI